jgi:hypothetical protein
MTAPEHRSGQRFDHELWREGTTMVLYVSVVLLAELSALPSGHGAHRTLRGPTGWQMVAIVWGTTIGLAVAHLFAFRLAAHSFGGRPRGEDVKIAAAQLAGAAAVAAFATLPLLLPSDEAMQRVIPFVLAVLIGVVAYLVARSSGRSRSRSLMFAGAALLLGLLTAVIKSAFAYH